MALNTIEKKIALHILNDYREMFAKYEIEREEAAREGFRPHYCIHGTNLWTDYDNICGPCEDGLNYWDYLTFLEIAKGEAQYKWESFTKELAEVAKLRKAFDSCEGMSREAREQANDLLTRMGRDAMDKIEKYQ